MVSRYAIKNAEALRNRFAVQKFRYPRQRFEHFKLSVNHRLNTGGTAILVTSILFIIVHKLTHIFFTEFSKIKKNGW